MGNNAERIAGEQPRRQSDLPPRWRFHAQHQMIGEKTQFWAPTTLWLRYHSPVSWFCSHECHGIAGVLIVFPLCANSFTPPLSGSTMLYPNCGLKSSDGIPDKCMYRTNLNPSSNRRGGARRGDNDRSS